MATPGGGHRSGEEDAGRHRAGDGGRRREGGRRLRRVVLAHRPVRGGGRRRVGEPTALCRIAVPGGGAAVERHGPNLPASRAGSHDRPRRLARRPDCPKGQPRRRGTRCAYGAVVESVSVSVFAYCPVRSASPAAIGCLKVTVTGVVGDRGGVVQQRRRSGRAADREAGAGRRAGRAARVDQQGLRERERAVDELARRGRARVGDRQRRVAGRGDDGGRRAGRVGPSPGPGRTRRSRRERRASARASPARCRRRRPWRCAPGRRHARAWR